MKSTIERLIAQLAARSRGVTFIGINYISSDTDFTSLGRRAELLLLLSRDGGSNLLAFQTTSCPLRPCAGWTLLFPRVN